MNIYHQNGMILGTFRRVNRSKKEKSLGQENLHTNLCCLSSISKVVIWCTNINNRVVSLKDSIQRHERNLIRSNFSRTVLAIERTYATQSDLEVKHMIFHKKYSYICSPMVTWTLEWRMLSLSWITKKITF